VEEAERGRIAEYCSKQARDTKLDHLVYGVRGGGARPAGKIIKGGGIKRPRSGIWSWQGVII